ncbi:hypothetical protein [Miniphocaeibacter massiliensis]|uniref:hypothetical protein n=1 Tax=Miniphocaeibacter massiliensis TaxID=2041841 RepID=UPI000C1B8C2B|nr:hypothetical protein [Miniphocaeibacter massiliensis]
MGTIIKPGAIKRQSTSLINTLQEQNNSLNDMKASILDIQNTEGLKSDAWDSLKSQIEIGHQNVINDLVAANDSVIADSNTLIGAVGSKDLDEDEIRSKIENLESLNNIYKSQQKTLSNQSKTNPASASYNNIGINILSNAITENSVEIAKYEADLREIRRIEAATESLYQNSEGLYNTVKAGIAVLNKSRGSGFSLPMSQTEWKSAVAEEKAILKLKENGFDDQRINHMRSVGISAQEMWLEWETLKTDEDKEFYLLMTTGEKENYEKMVKINPANVTDAITLIMGKYFRLLGDSDKHSEHLENFNNAIINASERFIMPINYDRGEVGETYGDIYLNRLIVGTSYYDDIDRAKLEEEYDRLVKSGDPYKNPEFKKMYNEYLRRSALTDFLLGEKIALSKLGKYENPNEKLRFPKITSLKYDEELGGYSANISYYDKFGERVKRKIDYKFLEQSNDVDNYYTAKELKALENQKENMLQNFVLNTAEGIALTLVAFYGTPALGSAIKLGSSIIKGKVGSIDGMLGIESELGKHSAKFGNNTISNLFDYWQKHKKVDSQLSKKYFEEKYSWFGTGRTITTIDETLDDLVSVGINEPEMRHFLKEWKDSEKGMTSWKKLEYDSKNEQYQILTKIQEDIDEETGRDKKILEEEKDKVDRLIKGDFKLDSKKGIKEFKEMVDAYNKHTGRQSNLQQEWREFINEKATNKFD